MANYIDLYTPALDWITATSFDDLFYEYWENRLDGAASDRGKESKVMQYVGIRRKHDVGSSFIGTAEQNGRVHHMLRLSGNLAEVMKAYLFAQVRVGQCNVTRLDVQVTIPEPSDWSQWKLFNRAKKALKTVGWIESRGGKAGQLETVYIGNRKSGRMTRVYVKTTAGDERLLRFETEYKGARSNAVARAMARDGELVGNFILYELQKTIRDDDLYSAFAEAANGNGPVTVRIRQQSSLEKSERWLLSQVLPTFSRVINDHNSTGDVLYAFLAEIDKRMNDN